MNPEYLWWGGMWIFPVMILCVILFAVYLFFGKSTETMPCKDEIDDKSHNAYSLEILKKRYARGEISKDAFEQIKKNIM